MAIQSVSFQFIQRELVHDEEKCFFCYETKSEDSGKNWWAHLNSTDQFVHPVHETCLRKLAFVHKNCPSCRTSLDQSCLPSYSLKERIGKILYTSAPIIGRMVKISAGVIAAGTVGLISLEAFSKIDTAIEEGEVLRAITIALCYPVVTAIATFSIEYLAALSSNKTRNSIQDFSIRRLMPN